VLRSRTSPVQSCTKRGVEQHHQYCDHILVLCEAGGHQYCNYLLVLYEAGGKSASPVLFPVSSFGEVVEIVRLYALGEVMCVYNSSQLMQHEASATRLSGMLGGCVSEFCKGTATKYWFHSKCIGL
jgi:hypothetical protein